MTRLQRLRTIRRIELDRGLRGLAVAETRLAQLARMRERLAGLAADQPADLAHCARQAAAASRERLDAAAAQVAAALTAAQDQRDRAAIAASRLSVRVDVVDAALARR